MRTESAAGGSVPDSTAPHGGGSAQATVLLVCMTFPVLAAVLIAPVQPQIVAAFAATPGVAVLVPALLTVPSLAVGLASPLAGRLLDRFGRVRLLALALVAYSVFGTAPLWLDSLPLLVATRFVVGLADAMILTAVTTLIGDSWSGRRRERIFALTTVVTSLSAIVFLTLGGLLGGVAWRAPFWLYAAAVVVAAVLPLVLREPVQFTAGRRSAALPPLLWRPLVVPGLVLLFGGVMFAVPLVELSYRLVDVGVAAVAVIGLLSAVAAVGTAAGSLAFGIVSRFGPARLLPLAFGVAGIGTIVFGLATSVTAVAVGATVASVGAGLLLPTMLAWAVSGLRLEERGRGSGWLTAAFWIGQFVLPLVVLAGSGAGGAGGVLVLLGMVALLVAAVCPALVRRRSRAVSQSAT